jgi:hypothetical protein
MAQQKMPETIHVHRLQGQQPFAEAVDEVDDCLRQAVAKGASLVLIDVRGLTGFAKPDLLSRVSMVRRWASTSRGRLKVAMISPPELNDGERFDVVLAQGLGFDGNVFESEEDARHWLEQKPALWTGPPSAF